MKKTWLRFIEVILLLLLVVIPAEALELFPIEEVKPGMVGYGRTVIEGNKVESFDVEVLGTLEYQGLQDQLILVRVGGSVMEKSGGIAQGMSGSPVYLDGKLLGALSYGYGFADHFIGMVTPIKSMLSILDLVPGEQLQLSQPIEYQGQRYESVSLQPVATPLLVSGMGPRGVARLEKFFQGQNVTIRNWGAGKPSFTPPPLEGGSPIAVDLIQGDIRTSALGTITYIDDAGRFIAFGHPFANRGASNYYASYAEVLTTVKSIDTPFKVGKAGPSFGLVSQDRTAGIAGQIGGKPKTIPVQVKVRDLDLQKDRTFNFVVIEDPILSLNLIDAAVLQAVDTAIDRIGAGTASIQFTISSADLPAGGFTRRNLFFSSFDISAISISELFEALDLVLHNEFKEVDISQITVDIMAESQRRTAKIEAAYLLDPEVYPGDTVEVAVTLRPWRSNPINRVVRLEIPSDSGPGQTTVTVRHGAYLGYAEDEGKEHPDETDIPGKPENPTGIKPKKSEPSPKTNAESLELLIGDFVLREKNNEIVVEFYPPYAYSSEEDEAELEATEPVEEGEDSIPEIAIDTSQNNDSSKPIQASLGTEYVIEGSTSFSMEIRDYLPWDESETDSEWPGKSIRLNK